MHEAGGSPAVRHTPGWDKVSSPAGPASSGEPDPTGVMRLEGLVRSAAVSEREDGQRTNREGRWLFQGGPHLGSPECPGVGAFLGAQAGEGGISCPPLSGPSW